MLPKIKKYFIHSIYPKRIFINPLQSLIYGTDSIEIII